MVAPPFPLWAWLVFGGLVLALLILDRFVYLHYGLAAILVLVGAKFVAQGFGLQIPILASLLVIAAAIIVTIVASLIATRGGKHGEGGTGLGPSTHETDGCKRG